jgi:hypothetical protein
VAVVVNGHDRLVAAFPVEAGDDRVERLGGVAGDDELAGLTAGHGRELVARGGLVGNRCRAQVIGALVVLLANLGDEGFEDGLGLDAVVAVFEIDVIRLETVLGAHGLPEVLAPGKLRGGEAGELGPELVAEEESESRRDRGAKEVALVHRTVLGSLLCGPAVIIGGGRSTVSRSTAARRGRRFGVVCGDELSRVSCKNLQDSPSSLLPAQLAATRFEVGGL